MHSVISSDRCETAYHEAGHAVIGCLVGWPPVSATIIGDGLSSGHVEFDKGVMDIEASSHDPDQLALLLQACVLIILAGNISENRYKASVGEAEDEAHEEGNAVDLIWRFIDDEDERALYLLSAKEKVSQMLAENWHSIEIMATELLVFDSLSGSEITSLVWPRAANGTSSDSVGLIPISTPRRC